MKRPIESKQRKVRMLNLIVSADGTAVSGPDQLQVSVADTGTGVKTVTLDEAYHSASSYVVQVTTATADSVAQVSITSKSVFVVNTFDSTDGTTAKDAICHISVVGTDVSGPY